MSKSVWSTYGIIYKHNPVMDKMVTSTIDKMSFSYSLTGKQYHIQTCDELTEVMMFNLYQLKYWKTKGISRSYGIIKDDVDFHIKNLSNDIKLIKRLNMWSYKVEQIVNDYYKKREEQEQRIMSLSKQEQEQIRQAQFEKMLKEMGVLGFEQ